MLSSIEEARHTVDMMTFVYWRGDIARRFAAALAARARAGLRVRLLLDGFGSRLIEPELLEEMDAAGVQVAWFRKPLYLSPLKQNHRCHRKVLVVDEQTAFTGGVGIAQEWCGDARNPGEWRDTHVEVRGPAVDGIAAAFAQNWAECHAELFDDRDRFVGHEPSGDAIVQVVRGSASFGWQDMQTLIRVILESAEERVRLATAYFAPDTYFVDLLCATARRGVEVQILLPGPHTDKRVSPAGGPASLRSADRQRCEDLRIPADHDARQDHHHGRGRLTDRLHQLQPALPGPRRRGDARRHGPELHRRSRRALRHRPQGQ